MIIVSITGPTKQDAIAQMSRSRTYASLFELRLDLFDAGDLKGCIKGARRPVVVTCRPVWEGGMYGGNDDDRLALLSKAVHCGAAFVDLEYNLGVRKIRQFMQAHSGVKVIVSRHLFNPKLPNAASQYRAMRATGASVLKLAYRAGDASDCGKAFEFLSMARADRQKAIAIAMGEAGEPSRILYRKYGGWATFAAPVGGPPAADGQLPANMLHDLFRANRLNRSTRVFGVIGDPVRYSKGIYIHNPLFQRARKNAVYCRFAVGDLSRFMREVGPTLHGMSVTLPHKLNVMDYLDQIANSARRIGAVNTVVRRANKLIGENTDGPGALDAIERKMPVKGKSLLVLGSGGAARAIVVEALMRGARVLVANRTHRRAVELAHATGAWPVRLDDVQSVDIVANATSVGMAPETERTPLPAGTLRMKIAFDAVYQPAETRFLREAKEAGAGIVSGIEMYLNQAARQFRMYTGIAPQPRFMRRLFENVAKM